MIAIPIPDEYVWPNSTRRVIGPPRGTDPTGPIRAVEAVVDLAEVEGTVFLQYHFLIELEAGDLEALTETGRFYLTTVGIVPPFCLTPITAPR